jgi:carnosine N-methyltransferase
MAHTHQHHHDSESYHGDPLEPPTPTEERESDEIEEQKHFQKVLMALAFYRRHSLIMNNRRRHDYNLIPQHHKKLLPEYLQKVDQVDKLIEENALVLKEIVKASGIFSETEVQATIMNNRGKKVGVIQIKDLYV